MMCILQRCVRARVRAYCLTLEVISPLQFHVLQYTSTHLASCKLYNIERRTIFASSLVHAAYAIKCCIKYTLEILVVDQAVLACQLVTFLFYVAGETCASRRIVSRIVSMEVEVGVYLLVVTLFSIILYLFVAGLAEQRNVPRFLSQCFKALLLLRCSNWCDGWRFYWSREEPLNHSCLGRCCTRVGYIAVHVKTCLCVVKVCAERRGGYTYGHCQNSLDLLQGIPGANRGRNLPTSERGCMSTAVTWRVLEVLKTAVNLDCSALVACLGNRLMDTRESYNTRYCTTPWRILHVETLNVVWAATVWHRRSGRHKPAFSARPWASIHFLFNPVPYRPPFHINKNTHELPARATVKVRYSGVVTTYRMKPTLLRFTHSANEVISSMLCPLQAPNFNSLFLQISSWLS